MLTRDALKLIIKEVFNVEDMPEGEINNKTVPGWDSIGHFKLILHLEERLGRRFAMKAIPNLTTIESLLKEVNQ